MWNEVFDRLCEEESGATAIEYAILAAMLALIAIGGASAFGASAELLFNTTSDIVVAELNNP
ncbi:MAG: Flp family type IVb pilin [Myxococcota bacterium]